MIVYNLIKMIMKNSRKTDKILDNSKMRKFIFLTFEWFTQDPNLSEIENVQMIWISNGKDSKDAFENLKKENEWLIDTAFNELYCHELKNKVFEYFSLKE